MVSFGTAPDSILALSYIGSFDWVFFLEVLAYICLRSSLSPLRLDSAAILIISANSEVLSELMITL